MKDNKGFTLVELLAVIAILAILVIIALPNVMSMFNEAKKNSFNTELKELYKQAQQTWIADSMFNTSDRIYAKNNTEACTKQLDMSGRNEIEYYIRVDKAGNIVEYYATDGTYQYVYQGNSLDITNIDSVAEIASLSDNEIITVDCNGFSYASLGRPINVCVYTSDGMATLGKINKTCYSKQTAKQCLGDSTPVNVALYKTEESNPGEDNIQKCRDERSGHIQWCYTCLMPDRKSYYTLVSRESLVLPSSNGCYAVPGFRCLCLDGDSEVEVYDKKKKRKYKKKLKDITYDDLILCWNFDERKFEYEKPLWIMNPTLATRSIILEFSDGNTLKVVEDHRIFDYSNGLFAKASEIKIGFKTININGDIITLINKEIKDEKILAYNVIVNKHINMYASNILTSQGSNNIYKIEDMKFIKENKETFSLDEINNIPNEYIEGLRLNEWYALDKGSKKDTLNDLNEYVRKLINNKK